MNQFEKKIVKKFDVVGIGNAIVDVLMNVEDSFINEHNLIKGSMALIEEEQAESLFFINKTNLLSSGGSVANSLAGISKLGGKAGFIGRVKDDKIGEIFTHDISSTGAAFNTPPIKEGPSTGRCLIFVTPDAERTMCTYLGASTFLCPDDLNLSMVREAKVLYLEGYLWDHPIAKQAFIKASEECKLAEGKIALSLSDSFCVERHRSSFNSLLEDYVDILFANESEILALCESNDLNNAIEKVRSKCEICVITLGEKGSIILNKRASYKIEPYIFGKAIDTTGAGDLFAGGFLYGYTKGESLIKSGQIGSICSGQIVTQLGPRSKASLVDLVERNL